MSQLLTISEITQEALPVLTNNLALTRAVNKQYSKEFAITGAKIGNVVNARVPPRYTVSQGPALDLQDSIETFVPVTLTYQHHIDIPFSTADLTLSVDDYRDRFLVPAMTSLANKVDYQMASDLYLKVPNLIGTPASLSGYTTATQASTYVLQAKQKLIENGAPDTDDLAFIVSPGSQTSLVSLFTNLFNPQGTISKTFTRGAMGDNILGFNFAASANIPNWTAGSYVQGSSSAWSASADYAGLVSPPSDRTSSYLVTAQAAGASTVTVTAGTIITFANVYEVNPQTRQSTGNLKQFVVVTPPAGTSPAYTFNGANAVNLYIWPTPIFVGQFQNAYAAANKISSGATITAPVTVSGTSYAQNLAFHPSAFTLATADLELIQDGATSARGNYEGISMRTLKTYLPGTDQQVLRMDILWGSQVLYPEMAVRATA
jgi:hypothetical protein